MVAETLASIEATRNSLVVQMLDGGSVSLEIPWTIGPATVTGTIRMSSGEERALLMSSPPTAEDLARDPVVSTGMEFVESYGLSGGQLRLGSGGQPKSAEHEVSYERASDGTVREKLVHMALWDGDSFTLHTFQYGGEVDSLRSFYEAMRIEESPTGVRVAPRTATNLAFVQGPWTIVDLPGIGALEIAQMTAWRQKEVPTYEGTPVVSGELYVSRRDDGSHRAYYVIVNETTFATFVPYPGSDETRVAAVLETSQIFWSLGAREAE